MTSSIAVRGLLLLLLLLLPFLSQIVRGPLPLLLLLLLLLTASYTLPHHPILFPPHPPAHHHHPGVAAELALTARVVRGPEAAKLRLVSSCYEDRAAMMAAVLQLARQIAAKSPLAVAGTKAVLLHTR